MANRVQTPPIWGDFQEEAAVETTNDTEAVAIELTVLEALDAHPDWTYSATAENNPTGGNMDDLPGLIYSGPAGTTAYFVFSATNIDVAYGSAGSADPDNEDTVSCDVYVNSTLAIASDEGQSTFANEAASVEFNITAETVAVVEGDVIRLALTPVAANETSIDWEVVEGGEWSLA